MKSNMLTRLLCVALFACAPAGLVRCGGTATQVGTETGNPPVIDNQKLRLEWTPNGVRLTGDPGAVTPGAEVRLTNTRTGDSASAAAGADGSLSLEVSGNLSDPYEVRVTAAGREKTESLSGDTSSGDLTTLSCQELESRFSQAIADSLANADASCSTNEDCVHPGLISCDNGCGYGYILSRAGEASARSEAERRTAPICAELDRCQRSAPPCIPAPEPVLSCVEGRCVGNAPVEDSCLDLASEASTRAGAAVAGADHTCTIDADCSIVFPSVRCVPPCRYAVAVASSAATTLQDLMAQEAEPVCQEFDNQACPRQIIPCPAPPIDPRAVCRSNRCEVQEDL